MYFAFLVLVILSVTKDPKYGNEALPYDGCIVYHMLQNDRKIYRSIFIELSPHSLQYP